MLLFVESFEQLHLFLLIVIKLLRYVSISKLIFLTCFDVFSSSFTGIVNLKSSRCLYQTQTH